MMMMAASAGSVGADVFDGKSIIMNTLGAWLIVVGITIVLRIGVLCLYAWAKEGEAGVAENAGTVWMVGYISADRNDLNSSCALDWGHC